MCFKHYLFKISDGIPKKRDLFPTGSSRAINPCITIINNCFAVLKDEYLIAVDPKCNSIQDGVQIPASGSAIPIKPINTPSDNITHKSFKSLAWSQNIQALGR